MTDELDALSLEQAAELFAAAAELLAAVEQPLEDLTGDELTKLLARIRDAVSVVDKLDALICARLVRDRWGTHEVDGLGVVKYRRTARLERWDERGAAFAVVAAKMEERGGVVPDDPREVVEWLLEAASVGYFRKTALRAMHIDPNDYWNAEKGNPAVDLPRRRI